MDRMIMEDSLDSEETEYEDILRKVSRVKSGLDDSEYEDILWGEGVEYCYEDIDEYEELFFESDFVCEEYELEEVQEVEQAYRQDRTCNANISSMKEKNRIDKKLEPVLTENYDMHRLEQVMLEHICIRRIHEHLYYFDGHVFRPLDKRQFLRLMRNRLPDEIIQGISSYSKLEEVYKYLDTNCDIKMEITEKEAAFTKRLIVFRNGIYDADQGKLLPFSDEYPVFFDIDACYLNNAEQCRTPHFDRFIENVSKGDKNIEDQILQMIGYLMLQGTEGKCFFVLGTKKNSGKSLLGEFIASLYDEDAVANIPLTSMGERFALGSLWKKAVNVSMDLPTKMLTVEDVSRIKLLTGERRINTEEKYEPSGTSFIYCKSIFATNGCISLKVNDDAFWDRLVFIPFMNSVDDECQDKDLLNKLLRERDGIVTKAAKSVKILIQNNFKFPNSEMGRQIINNWRMQTDCSIKNFLYECCELSCENGEFSSDIYEDYKQYCQNNNLTVVSNTAVIRYLKKLPGITSSKKRRNPTDNPTAYIEGIRLKCREG